MRIAYLPQNIIIMKNLFTQVITLLLFFPILLIGQNYNALVIHSPSSIAGTYPLVTSNFRVGAGDPKEGIIELVNDGVGNIKQYNFLAA